MEEDIKFLIRDLKAMGYNQHFINQLENLIKGYRELERYYEEQNEVNAKFIPKSKIKEKIEELETKLKVFEKDIRYCKDRVQARLMNDEIYVLRRCMDLLKELMEDK